jgi:nucleotide-binding universal stress UspA family protein
MGFAKHFGAEIYPAHACDPIILTEAASPGLLDDLERYSHERLLKLAKINGLKGTPLFARGPVESAVPGWINEHGIDLIVMGTHGRRGLQHLLMGSVAEAIFRYATCPVLTVGPHVNVRPYHEFKAEKILSPRTWVLMRSSPRNMPSPWRMMRTRNLHSCTLSHRTKPSSMIALH